MRTTIDLPDDLHRWAKAAAQDSGRTLSETVVLLLRRALGEGPRLDIEPPPSGGLPTVRLGRLITAEDVRALEDDG